MRGVEAKNLKHDVTRKKRRDARRIARQEGINLSSYTTERDIARLKQNAFDGVDMLSYALWSATQALEAKALND